MSDAGSGPLFAVALAIVCFHPKSFPSKVSLHWPAGPQLPGARSLWDGASEDAPCGPGTLKFEDWI